MSGWDKKYGDIKDFNITEDALWEKFNFVFSTSCAKRNSYKFAFLKSILDNLFNCTFSEEQKGYIVSFDSLFSKFVENYWNLIRKYKLVQIRPDGKSSESAIEKIVYSSIEQCEELKETPFENIKPNIKKRIVKKATTMCKKNVIGAVYEDFDGLLYAFNLKEQNSICINPDAYLFMIKYKHVIEIMNYYSWAKYLEGVNDEEKVYKLLDKLELSTPRRENLSPYQIILQNEFREKNCFYCGKELRSGDVHVDHVVPWSFVRDDFLWNLVLACSECNESKNNKVPSEEKYRMVKERNNKFKDLQATQKYFKGYSSDKYDMILRAAEMSGIKEWNRK